MNVMSAIIPTTPSYIYCMHKVRVYKILYRKKSHPLTFLCSCYTNLFLNEARYGFFTIKKNHYFHSEYVSTSPTLHSSFSPCFESKQFHSTLKQMILAHYFRRIFAYFLLYCGEGENDAETTYRI